MKKKVVGILLYSILAACLTAGCGGEETTADGYAKEIYLYNWSEYMTQDVLDQFEDEYGIKVVQSTFESNDEMLAKLLTANQGEYDIAVPSNFYIQAMEENDLLEEIDKEALTNYDNLDEAYLGMDFDPDNTYTVPYMGTVCPWIGNSKMLDELGVEVNSMSDLTNPALAGNIELTDDAQADIGIGLTACGYDQTSTNLDEIAEAKEFLLSINDNVKSYANPADVRDAMAKGEVALSQMYSGVALQAMAQNPDLEIVMNEEDCSLSMDTLVILKGTSHKEEAELFIDFLLRPEISAELTNEYQYVCFNKAAVEYLDENLAESPLCVLTEDLKSRLYLINTFDADAISAEIDAMTEVKSAR